MKEGIYKYKDGLKKFILTALQKIDYFQGVGEDALHDILYNLQSYKCEKGMILQVPTDEASSMLFIQNGILEVYAEIEKQEFIIERLYKGSIINHRTFFQQEQATLYIRVTDDAVVYALPIQKMNSICSKHKMLEEKFLKFQTKINIDSKIFHIDYILNLPEELRNAKYKAEQQEKVSRLMEIQKNVVMTIIMEVRKKKERLGLKDLIMVSMKKKNQRDEKMREIMKHKLHDMYLQNVDEFFSDGDHYFSRVMGQCNRLLKKLRAHATSIDGIEKKMAKVTHVTDNFNLALKQASISSQ